MLATPNSEHDWTIHSLNIQGLFFQRWCQKVISDTGTWRIKATDYPVEFPRPNGPFRGKESTLDIRAELSADNNLLTLIIECKKNNPEFINWVFFLKHPQPVMSTLVVSRVHNIPRPDPNPGWTTEAALRRISFTVPVADEAREVRASYVEFKRGDKTKSSNSAIIDAAHQVAIANQAISLEEERFSRALALANPPVPMQWGKQVFLPIIVTSARIFTCAFDPGDVDPASGEIPFDKAVINGSPYVLYEYPLPRSLQLEPGNLVDVIGEGAIELFVRKHILVVNTEKLVGLLNELLKFNNRFWV